LQQMMETAGFQKAEFFNLAGGAVAVHRAYRF
jgi:ubiquinone/menaquinone biosynthesis C-methylase UbiE